MNDNPEEISFEGLTVPVNKEKEEVRKRRDTKANQNTQQVIMAGVGMGLDHDELKYAADGFGGAKNLRKILAVDAAKKDLMRVTNLAQEYGADEVADRIVDIYSVHKNLGIDLNTAASVVTEIGFMTTVMAETDDVLSSAGLETVVKVLMTTSMPFLDRNFKNVVRLVSKYGHDPNEIKESCETVGHRRTRKICADSRGFGVPLTEIAQLYADFGRSKAREICEFSRVEEVCDYGHKLGIPIMQVAQVYATLGRSEARDACEGSLEFEIPVMEVVLAYTTLDRSIAREACIRSNELGKPLGEVTRDLQEKYQALQRKHLIGITSEGASNLSEADQQSFDLLTEGTPGVLPEEGDKGKYKPTSERLRAIQP